MFKKNAKLNSKILKMIIMTIFAFNINVAQNTNLKGTYVDKTGVLRWHKNSEEVKGFGVNYTVPFAHAYRSAKRLGIDVKTAIDNDIYHFKRLGFDLFRVHIWDTQISDVHGNLLNNEHLDAFDYLISKLKEKDINYVITPIAFWGNGWPEPDTKSPGFSHLYGKQKALIDSEAIKAQQTYLFQFINHVNSYTKTAYKDDPNIIAFEVSNEPHHRGEAKDVTRFVEKMIKAIKKTGTKTPVFYNMSHAVHFAEAYFKGGAQGGTFQWYPTGLGFKRELSGNLLPNVDNYYIPFDRVFKKYNGAKLVYEFDAADVNKSYIYPAMARSFRTAGIQVATHFSYDPTYLANVNTEYNTHYMNLLYTPSKALALKISSEIFHQIPMYKTFGKYPENTTFGTTFIDYKSDLAIYDNGQKLIYTNSNTISPKNENNINEIAGYGNSSLVNYNGKGAYFLDKISKGLWRLEILPDAIIVNNVFGINSPDKNVAVLKYNLHQMQIQLKDLTPNFKITAINKDNSHNPDVSNGSFLIQPGVYILSSNAVAKAWKKTDSFKTYQLQTFVAPNDNVDRTYLNHTPLVMHTERESLEIKAQVVSNSPIESVVVKGNISEAIFFQDTLVTHAPYIFKTTLNKSYLEKGFLNYNLIVNHSDGTSITYPVNKKGNIYDWDFYDRQPYQTKIEPSSFPIYLFDAKTNFKDVIWTWRKGIKLVPIRSCNEAELQIPLDPLFIEDKENLEAKPIYDYSFKYVVSENIKGRLNDLDDKQYIKIKAKSLENNPINIQVALVLDDGSSFGVAIPLSNSIKTHVINLTDLKPVNTVTLPRPYPTFLPYFFEHNNKNKFNIETIESIQISIGPRLSKNQKQQSLGIGLVNIWLE